MSKQLMAAINGIAAGSALAPIPTVPPPQEQNSVPMDDSRSFPEMKLNIPVAPGPFEPTWESIEIPFDGTALDRDLQSTADSPRP